MSMAQRKMLPYAPEVVKVANVINQFLQKLSKVLCQNMCTYFVNRSRWLWRRTDSPFPASQSETKCSDLAPTTTSARLETNLIHEPTPEQRTSMHAHMHAHAHTHTHTHTHTYTYPNKLMPWCVIIFVSDLGEDPRWLQERRNPGKSDRRSWTSLQMPS